MLPSCQGGNQHHQSGFRQMEIGDQGVQYLEAVARIDKNIRVVAAFLQMAVFIAGALHGAAAGGTHADHPVAVLLRPVDFLRRFRAHLIVFGMHVVLLHVFHLHRAEGAKAHMQGHIGQIHAHVLNLL